MTALECNNNEFVAVGLGFSSEGDLARAIQSALNFLTVSQLYLRGLPNERFELCQEDIKRKPLGHWGACSGINFILAALTTFTASRPYKFLPIIGTGHAGASWNSWLFLRNLLPDTPRTYAGASSLALKFGGPDGLPAEILSSLPYTFFSGGEIGPALSAAYGASLHNPGSFVPCIMGDGELETGPALAALQFPHVLNPKSSALLLPIVNLNQYRMGSRSILSRLSRSQLELFFRGFGFTAYVVDEGYDAFFWALHQAEHLFNKAREQGGRFRAVDDKLPLIVFRSDKGFGIPEIDGVGQLSDTHRAHKTPLSNPHGSSEQFMCLSKWIGSYYKENLFEPGGNVNTTITSVFDSVPLFEILKRQIPPSVDIIEVVTDSSPARSVCDYIKSLVDLSNQAKPLMVFSPDELLSNQGEKLVAGRGLLGNSFINNSSATFHLDSPCVELLSEHFCFGSAQGYSQTGGKCVFISYEAFAPVVSSMLIQQVKFLESSRIKSSESLNCVITSPLWRNSYTHQNPDFMNSLLTLQSARVEVYVAYDANSAQAAFLEMFESRCRVNALYCSKSELPSCGRRHEAVENVRRGFAEFTFGEKGASTRISALVIGDYQLCEAVRASKAMLALSQDVFIELIVPTRLSQFYIKTSESLLHSRLESLQSPLAFFSFLGSNYAARALSSFLPESIRTTALLAYTGIHGNGPADLILTANRCSRVHMFEIMCQKVGRTLTTEELAALLSQIEHPCGSTDLPSELLQANEILKGRIYN